MGIFNMVISMLIRDLIRLGVRIWTLKAEGKNKSGWT